MCAHPRAPPRTLANKQDRIEKIACDPINWVSIAFYANNGATKQDVNMTKDALLAGRETFYMCDTNYAAMVAALAIGDDKEDSLSNTVFQLAYQGNVMAAILEARIDGATTVPAWPASYLEAFDDDALLILASAFDNLVGEYGVAPEAPADNNSDAFLAAAIALQENVGGAATQLSPRLLAIIEAQKQAGMVQLAEAADRLGRSLTPAEIAKCMAVEH